MTQLKPETAQVNLIVLHKHHPDTAKKLLEHLRKQRETGEDPAFILEPDSQGRAALNPAGKRSTKWRLNLPASDFEHVPPDVRCVLVYSAGSGSVISILRAIHHPCKIILVEPHFDILFAAFQAADWSDVLPLDDLYLLCGTGAEQKAMELVTRHPSLLKNGVRCIAGRRLLEEEEGGFEELQLAVAASTSPQPAEPQPEIRVDETTAAILAGDAHYTLLDCLQREAEAAGIHARAAVRTAALNRFLDSDEALLETLGGDALPKHLLTFSGKCLRGEEWQRLKEYGVKRMLWCYDDPHRAGVDETFFDTFDQIFCFDPIITERLQNVSPVPVQYMPAAAMVFDETALDVPGDLPQPLEITLVGSTGLQRQDDAMAQLITAPNSPYVPLRNWVLHSLQDGRPSSYDELMNMPFNVGGMTENLKTVFKQDLATFAVRLYYLSALEGLPLTIFGDEGWAQPKWVGALSGRYAGRSLDYQRETPYVYRNSKISLNTFNVQCVNSPTIRMFDVMAQGGFLLTEHRPFIEEAFTIGTHLETFRTREELREKAAHYLAHESERNAIAQQGKEFVMQHHLYRHRLEKMLKV